MVRIHLMQSWWSLSNEAMEDALIDMGAIRCFARIDPAKDTLDNPKALSQKTPTPLLQQGF